jgi:hypothetical protein
LAWQPGGLHGSLIIQLKRVGCPALIGVFLLKFATPESCGAERSSKLVYLSCLRRLLEVLANPASKNVFLITQ